MDTRKPARLPVYDYTSPGYYFVTICTRDREELLWEPHPAPSSGVGADIIRPYTLSRIGTIVDDAIRSIPIHYENVCVDKYVIMPNHVHMVLQLTATSGRIISAPTKNVSTIIGQMKRAASKKAGITLWQKGYYDHIIRNEADYLRIWNYIDTNPVQWTADDYYTPQ